MSSLVATIYVMEDLHGRLKHGAFFYIPKSYFKLIETTTAAEVEKVAKKFL